VPRDQWNLTARRPAGTPANGNQFSRKVRLHGALTAISVRASISRRSGCLEFNAFRQRHTVTPSRTSPTPPEFNAFPQRHTFTPSRTSPTKPEFSAFPQRHSIMIFSDRPTSDGRIDKPVQQRVCFPGSARLPCSNDIRRFVDQTGARISSQSSITPVSTPDLAEPGSPERTFNA
jgi:hypothetical protein